jgi:hypothetical protein
MPSKLRSDTARANGAKSRGPKSPEGKEISSRNALRHGFTARHTLVLASESEDQFNEFEREFTAMHAPANPAEQDMVNEMIAARWRIQRLRAAQVFVLESEKPAFRTLADESFSIGEISRLESRLQRDFHRAYRVLRELQQDRKGSDQEPPNPGKPTLHAVPAPKNDATKKEETNPAVPAALQRAVDRHFAKIAPNPDFVLVAQAVEPLLSPSFHLKAAENVQSPAAALSCASDDLKPRATSNLP